MESMKCIVGDRPDSTERGDEEKKKEGDEGQNSHVGDGGNCETY